MVAKALILLIACALPLQAWGRKGHEIVASAMVRSLPPGAAAWLQPHEELLRAHCTDPDQRRHDRKEPPRHFLNVESYGGPHAIPFEAEVALRRVGAKAFQRSGQVPWIIQDRLRDLVEAFQARQPKEVALAAALLSHYVADLHVPLHTTRNHDGQETGQRGIHGRWESGLAERFVSGSDIQPPPAMPEEDLPKAPWRWLRTSHAQVEGVLASDRTAALGSAAGRGILPQRTRVYWLLFGAQERDRVKRQLEASALHTAQLVLYAWELAGRPPAS